MKKTKKHITYQAPEPSGITLKQLSYAVYRNRYWFLAGAFAGLICAVLYNSYVPQKYSASTTVLIKTDNSQALLTSIQANSQDDKKNITVHNQVGVINSFTVNYQTVKNLKWGASWGQKNLFTTKDLYGNAPYRVDISKNSDQITDVPVKIEQVSAGRYRVSCDAVRERNGIKQKISFDDSGYFARPFKNKYLNFTLHKIRNRPVDNGDEFILTFNDEVMLAKSFQEDLKISTGDEESNLISIELINRNADRAIDYLNELGNVYIKYGLSEKNRLAANTVTFINNQIAGISDSLQNSGDNFSEYRASNNVVDINQQSSAIVNDISKIQSALSASQMKLEYFRSLKRYLSNASAMKSLVSPSVAGITDESLNARVAQLSNLFSQREVMSYTAQEGSPQLVALDNQISYTQKSLSENVNNLIGNTQIEIDNLNGQRQSVYSQRSVLPKTEQKLNSIKRNFDLNNEIYTYLLQKRSEAQIAQASRDPDARILDEASLGTLNLKGFSHLTNLVIGMIIGLLLPLAYATGSLFLKKNLTYVSEVKNQLQPSIIGSILFNKFENELPVITYPHSEIAESFRGLRINMQYLLKNYDTKVISVHSSVAGEGKTFVSANLAAILAMNNKRVLLIDADLRKSRTHKIFDCPNKTGLSNYLKGKKNYDEVITETRFFGLNLVTSGPDTDFPSELLSNGKLENFITQARNNYEYIVINNAPLSIVKDAMMVVPYCDLNLFLLRMNSSSVNQLNYINQMVQEGIIKNVVVALNNVTADNYAEIDRADHGYYNDNRLIGAKADEA